MKGMKDTKQRTGLSPAEAQRRRENQAEDPERSKHNMLGRAAKWNSNIKA